LAAASLRAYAAQLLPSTQVAAHAAALEHARDAAAAERPALAKQALAQARSRAKAGAP
jgi:hypothetical protein